MDPKRLEKLQLIQDWELTKPTKDKDWAEDVKLESLHVKFDYQLDEMLESHSSKVLKVEKDLEVFTKWPDVKRYELTQQFEQMFKDQGDPTEIEGKTLQQWIDEEFESQNLYYTWKVAKLNQSVERIAKEVELRVKGEVVPNKNDDKSFVDVKNVPEEKIRYLLGTTYYIDPTNGTDTFAGTRIDSTVDSTADTTHFVDNALTGADDYLNGSYFYNVTRSLGSLITDFVAASDTVTLGTAITGMTAGDTYYILNSWLDLDQFTENARSAGDKVIIRRGAVQCDDGSDLNFTSDGTIVAPIIIEADFDNLWRDQVDLSATATATLTFGSKTVTFSADISSVLAAGDWIYASGDNNKEFAYEVASVVTTTVTLYLPYKGDQAGAGRTMYNMQDNPIWNTAAGDFQWNFDTDDYWKVQGIHIRGTDANGNVEIDSSVFQQFNDCIFEGNATNDLGIGTPDPETKVHIRKCRVFNEEFIRPGASNFVIFDIRECLVDGNNVANTSALGIVRSLVYVNEMESKNIDDFEINRGTANSSMGFAYLRNFLFDASHDTNFINGYDSANELSSIVMSEDHDGVVGDNQNFDTNLILTVGGNTSTPLFQSETSIVRSGGSNKSIKVTPTTRLSSIWELSKFVVFEIPIYATTDSKQYDIYFRPSATGDWSADPTASELWIELEAWGHASNNFRKITKSTGVIDMNGSTSWQALTVTVAPAQAGVAYLRCWYAKTKEAGSNIFYVDPVPVIT